MAHATVTITYREEALRQLLDSKEGDVAKDLLRRAIKVENAAKRYVPVDTGRLRSSIGSDLQRDAIGLSAIIGSNVSYAIYVEMGTRYMRARPWLRPALREAT